MILTTTPELLRSVIDALKEEGALPDVLQVGEKLLRILYSGHLLGYWWVGHGADPKEKEEGQPQLQQGLSTAS